MEYVRDHERLLPVMAADTFVVAKRATDTVVDGPARLCARNARFVDTVTCCPLVEALQVDERANENRKGTPCVTEPVAGLGVDTDHPDGGTSAGTVTATVAAGAILIALSEHEMVCCPGTETVDDAGVQDSEKSVVATAREALSVEVDSTTLPLGSLI